MRLRDCFVRFCRHWRRGEAALPRPCCCQCRTDADADVLLLLLKLVLACSDTQRQLAPHIQGPLQRVLRKIVRFTSLHDLLESFEQAQLVLARGQPASAAHSVGQLCWRQRQRP